MSKYNLTDALNNVELVYSDIVDIANEMLDQIFEPINSLIDEIRNSGANSSTESIRGFMFRLQLKSFEISDTKEKSALKAECAEALRKEKYARIFNEASGTSGIKDNTALLGSSEELVVESLYNLVASLLKTKLDELHRLISVLQSILMSKMQEAKLSMNAID